jgi:hypothetical protein
VREGTYAAGAGRWPIDVQLQCDKFFDYLGAAVIVYSESPEQRERLSAEYDRIVKAFQHVIHRTLTVQEAERAITIFLACFNEQLPEGPDDHVRYPSGAEYFAQQPKPAQKFPHPKYGGPTYGLGSEDVMREAWRRVQGQQSSQMRFAIAKRALCVYHATYPRYTGHPEDKQTITRVLASISAEPRPEVHQQGQRTGMSPEHYVVWCLTHRWDPFTDQRLAYKLPMPEQYGHLPGLFSPLRHTPDDQRMNYNWARRQSNVAWLEEAVDSLHDLHFWEFNNQEEADMIGKKMRLMWLDDNNAHGRFSPRS